MKSQYKGGIESGVRVEFAAANGGGKWSGACDRVLRLFALMLTAAAAAVLGLDKETETVAIPLVPTLPPVEVQVTSKWQYFSAFVFFVVANGIACGYAAITLLLTLTNKAGENGAAMKIILFDLVTLALLCSSVGPAIAVAIFGYDGKSRIEWRKVCGILHQFCDQAAAAIGLSGAAAAVFVLLVVLAAVNLRAKD